MRTSYGHRTRMLGLLAAASLLATAACGSTVQPTGADALAGAQVRGGATAGNGLSADGLGPDTLTTDDSAEGAPSAGAGSGSFSSGSSVGSATSGSLAGSSGGAESTPGRSQGSGPATGSAAVAQGPGVTATSIFLGIPICTDCAAANGALGADGEDPGDTRRYYKALIDEVNGRGGVQGRKLVPVFHQYSASENIDTSAQAMCETFTKDNKVAAIFFRGEIIFQCAKAAGIIVVGQGGSGPLFERYPNLFSPTSIRFEQLGSATVKGMVAAGWHKPTAKWPTGEIGLITWDDNEYKYAVDMGWLPALQESGLKAKQVRRVSVPQSDKSLADSSAAISAAVLSFRDQGIDHVFIADGPAGIFRGGGLTLQFLNAARAQRYFPRYGFNTNNAPGDPALPADQQVGMLAVNGSDLQRSNDEGITPNPQRERCYALMNKNDLKATDGRATGITALAACEFVWFVEAVLKRSRGTTLPDVIAGAESLGTSYRSPHTYGTRIKPGRHDGLFLFRNARFDETCSCMKYTSKPYEP